MAWIILAHLVSIKSVSISSNMFYTIQWSKFLSSSFVEAVTFAFAEVLGKNPDQFVLVLHLQDSQVGTGAVCHGTDLHQRTQTLGRGTVVALFRRCCHGEELWWDLVGHFALRQQLLHIQQSVHHSSLVLVYRHPTSHSGPTLSIQHREVPKTSGQSNHLHLYGFDVLQLRSDSGQKLGVRNDAWVQYRLRGVPPLLDFGTFALVACRSRFRLLHLPLKLQQHENPQPHQQHLVDTLSFDDGGSRPLHYHFFEEVPHSPLFSNLQRLRQTLVGNRCVLHSLQLHQRMRRTGPQVFVAPCIRDFGQTHVLHVFGTWGYCVFDCREAQVSHPFRRFAKFFGFLGDLRPELDFWNILVSRL
ncbi:unnamed protein product [Tenebrio molitor]|nr:unnamed protein product [Tenebrio molitor]